MSSVWGYLLDRVRARVGTGNSQVKVVGCCQVLVSVVRLVVVVVAAESGHGLVVLWVGGRR